MRRAEETTRGMPAPELIEFYRSQASETERKLKLDLVSRPASETPPIRQ